MARKTAKIYVHPRFQVGDISPRLYGAFLEPIGTMVNGSMFNPKHPTADAKGFRHDFIDALRESGIPAVRLPGGISFQAGTGIPSAPSVSAGRSWTAWHQYYTNEIGHDEYPQWTGLIGAEPLYTINLGTNGPKDALHIVGVHQSRRRPTGRTCAGIWLEAPHGEIWYLGNEMDGSLADWLLAEEPQGL